MKNNKNEEKRSLSINIFDTILISEKIVLEIIIERLSKQKGERQDGLVVSIKEYRQLLGDQISTDEDIIRRLKYLEAFCGNIIRLELNKTYE